MYLFSRRIRIAPGHTRAAMGWALGQTEAVNKITGLQVGLYMQVFSPEVGIITWSTFFPDLAALESASDKLDVDDSFIAATDRGAEFILGGADDALAQVVHGAPDANTPLEYATVVRAVCASGSIARGLEVGVEIAQRAEKITGTTTLFLADVTGLYGGVSWATGHANVQAMDAAQARLSADSNFVQYIDKEVPGTYAEEPALTTQLIYRRLA